MCPSGPSGVMQGNFKCVSSPPTCLPQTFSFLERTAATKPIAVVLATPAATDQQLVFKINRVWGYNSKPQWGARVGVNSTFYSNGTFAINSCSGVITVVQDWKLDSKYVQNFTVEVSIIELQLSGKTNCVLFCSSMPPICIIFFDGTSLHAVGASTARWRGLWQHTG